MDYLMNKLDKYNYEEQINIMTIIKILDSKNLMQESDPFKVHIILGEKIRALEEDNKALDNNLEDLKEQCSQKEKAVEDLKYDLNHERVINEELEEDLDRKI
jgi:chromosome segregation ATPase